MKLIKAIVRPNKVDDVQKALDSISVSGMTVTEVRDWNRGRVTYLAKEYSASMIPKMEIEVVVGDDREDEVVQAIIHAARTSQLGAVGDGRIFVLPAGAGKDIREGKEIK